MNIITSCDDNIASYILPQLVSINKNLGMYDVKFYLMHSKVSSENLQLIDDFSKTQDNITFYELRVKNNKQFKNIDKYGDGRGIKGGRLWPVEAYYWYYAHLYLPQDMERIIYIDAGDIIITGDIGDYYFKDFNDKFFTANARLLITRDGKTDFFQKNDLDNIELLGRVLGAGTFCAGSIVLNLNKFREEVKEGYIDKYIESLKKIYPEVKCLFNGDQGLASGAFAGKIGYFMKPGEKDVWYRPYNFPVGNLYEREKEDFDFPVCIVHYNASLTYKPWVARFDKNEIAKYDLRVDGAAGPAPYMATPAIIEYNDIWWKYCEKTPIYEELNFRAGIAAEVLQKYFLPLCNDYKDLFVSNKELEEKYTGAKQLLDLLINKFPLLSGITMEDISYLGTIISAVLQNDLQAALDEVLRLSNTDIPDKYAECYLILAQNICAVTEYAEGWVMFKKEHARFLISIGNKEKADDIIKELDSLLPDDEEVIILRNQ